MNNMKKFQDRLKQCAAQNGGVAGFCQKAGVSPAQFRRYLNGTSHPTSEKILSMAHAAGKPAGWLLAGEKLAGGHHVIIIKDIFLAVVRQVEEALAHAQIVLTPGKKAVFILALYRAAQQAEDDEKAFLLSQNSVLEMLDFLSAFNKEDDIEELLYGIEQLPTSDNSMLNERWVNMLCRANIAVYDTASGMHYFDRMPDLRGEYGEECRKLIKRLQEVVPTLKNVLDLGCGNGRYLKYLHRHFPHLHLSGVDTSDYGLGLCRHLEQTRHLPAGATQKADMRHLPFDAQTFDLVLARNSLFCVPLSPDGTGGLDSVFAEAYRVLKPGGVFHGMSRYGTGISFYQGHQLLNEQDIRNLCRRHGLDLLSYKVFNSNKVRHASTPIHQVHEQMANMFTFNAIKSKIT